MTVHDISVLEIFAVTHRSRISKPKTQTFISEQMHKVFGIFSLLKELLILTKFRTISQKLKMKRFLIGQIHCKEILFFSVLDFSHHIQILIKLPLTCPGRFLTSFSSLMAELAVYSICF